MATTRSRSNKQKRQPPIPELCQAVRRVRTALDETQEAFARRIGVTLISVSRFERGTEPRDASVLYGLQRAAESAGMDPEAAAFATAPAFLAAPPGLFHNAPAVRTVAADSLAEWRLLLIARAAFRHVPHLVPAIEQAAGLARELVDGVLRDSNPGDLNAASIETEIGKRADILTLSRIRGEEERT